MVSAAAATAAWTPCFILKAIQSPRALDTLGFMLSRGRLAIKLHAPCPSCLRHGSSLLSACGPYEKGRPVARTAPFSNDVDRRLHAGGVASAGVGRGVGRRGGVGRGRRRVDVGR